MVHCWRVVCVHVRACVYGISLCFGYPCYICTSSSFFQNKCYFHVTMKDISWPMLCFFLFGWPPRSLVCGFQLMKTLCSFIKTFLHTHTSTQSNNHQFIRVTYVYLLGKVQLKCCNFLSVSVHLRSVARLRVPWPKQ